MSIQPDFPNSQNINDASDGNPINVTPDGNGLVVYQGTTYQRIVVGDLVQYEAVA